MVPIFPEVLPFFSVGASIGTSVEEINQKQIRATACVNDMDTVNPLKNFCLKNKSGTDSWTSDLIGSLVPVVKPHILKSNPIYPISQC